MNRSEDMSAERYPCPSLASKSIVIIGGTTGLGFSAARACINSGANVVVVGRNRDSATHAERELGTKAVALAGDAIDSATTTLAIDCAKDHFGRFDALYHVAAAAAGDMAMAPCTN